MVEQANRTVKRKL
jgi:hypothetical protein